MTDTPGPLLASGRSADVYDIGGDKVLRRYRPEFDDLDCGVEARIMRHVAERGYPVPTVHEVDGRDIVMDRIDGPTMLESLEASPLKLLHHARLLAHLQRELARLAAPEWMLASTADTTHPHSVLHLDLHPMNVLMAPDGPVVIDWTNAAGGPAGFDAALTYVVVSTFPTTSPRDRIGQRMLSGSFRRFRGRRDLDAFLAVACDHRLGDRNLLPEERVAVGALRRRVGSAT